MHSSQGFRQLVQLLLKPLKRGIAKYKAVLQQLDDVRRMFGLGAFEVLVQGLKCMRHAVQVLEREEAGFGQVVEQPLDGG